MLLEQKVFCVGFHKTGTTSLDQALTHLGYTTTGPNWIDNPHIEEEALALADGLIHQFDAFIDNPWPVLYKHLDQTPASIFILTIRDPESWIKSVVNHFGSTNTQMRQWIYGFGYPVGNEDVYLKRFIQHNQEVLDHFGDRILVLDLFNGDGWDKLCAHLGKEVPKIPFPHLNKARGRDAGIRSNAKSDQQLHQ